MPSNKKINSFDSVFKRLEKVSNRQGYIKYFHSYQTPAGSYPLIKIVLGKGNSRRALISAGIHGDEPGGVETILKFLEEEQYSPYLETWEITFLPCINPYGYEFGTREDHQGKDLNRLFKVNEPPIEVIFAQEILNTAFDLSMELHEDYVSHGYYLYQKGLDNKNDGIGLEILNAIKGIMPINLNDEIDGSPAYQGIIGKELDNSEMDWWPMALYGLSKGTRLCLTLETASSQFDLNTRIKAHLTAIKSALNNFQ